MRNLPRGQTLLESLLAVTVIVIGIVAIVSLFIALNIAGRQNQDQLVASYLAQEGIEVIRNIRDSNWLAQESGKSLDWTDNWTASADITAIPLLSFNYVWSLSFVPNDYSLLYQDPDTKVYRQFDGSVPANYLPTKWSRLLEISPLPSGNGYQIISKVKWAEQGKEHIFALAENIYDWRNY